MYNTSTEYKEQIRKIIRNPSHIKVNFGIVESDASTSSTLTDNGSMYYSDTQDVVLGKNVEYRYVTLEHNKFILDGGQLIPQIGIDPFFQGYISSAISNSSGVYTSPPVLTIEFSQLFSFIGLTFRFNSEYNNYVSEMRIKAYNNNVEVYNQIHNPTSSQFVLDEKIPAVGVFCDKLELHFLKSEPARRRVELSYIMFGIVETFENDRITDSTWSREISLISTRLPKNEFKFTIIDKDLDYNPENPTGTWEYLEERQPVWFQYGYELDNDTVEWLDGPNLYSIGEVTVSNAGKLPKVTFTASSVINQLDDIYYRGIYNPLGTSLYDLAVDVLEFANLPLLRGGYEPYIVSTELQSISTTIPVPELSIKEALQLIANAGKCIIDINRLGQIEIKPFVPIVPDLDTFNLTYGDMISSPILNKTPLLYSVDTYKTTVSLESGASVVHESEISLGSNTQCILKYDKSMWHSISTDGTLTVVGSPVYYAGSCVVTLVGTGKVYVTATKLVYSKDSISFIAGQTGYRCPIENELLDDNNYAMEYAEWVAGVVGMRNEYKVTDRGFPEFDPADTILADTLFTDKIESIITGSKIRYNGALRGETTYLSKEVIR